MNITFEMHIVTVTRMCVGSDYIDKIVKILTPRLVQDKTCILMSLINYAPNAPFQIGES